MCWFLLYFILFSISTGYSIKPIAIPQLIVNDNKPILGGKIIRIKGYDSVGNKLLYTIAKLPIYGDLYQLSHSYSNYGYKPIQGVKIVANNTIITDPNNRVFYSSKHTSRPTVIEHFTFTVYNGFQHSVETDITIVDKDGTIIRSDFLIDSEQWKIVGNKQPLEIPIFEPYSRGLELNHYIYGNENKINIDKYGDTDKSVWFFNAPSKFLGNMRMAYGGYLGFTIGIFACDISKLNYGKKANLIELECANCNGKKGITIVFPLVSSFFRAKIKGTMGIFDIPLSENRGWLKDPHNTLLDWNPPSKHEFIQVLTHLSGLRILGDITDWYETVAIDNIYFSNTKYIPMKI